MKLLLLPNLLGEQSTTQKSFPPYLLDAMHTLDGVIAECEKSARRFVRLFKVDAFKDLPIQILNEHTTREEIEELLEPIQKGETWGIISDCGLPCIADPGADLVLEAHKMEIPVETVVGPSSIVMALQLSGLHSQKFTFHGYFPYKEDALISWLHTERRKGGTHVFIEAPYRNRKRFDQLLEHLHDKTYLTIAVDLMQDGEQVITRTALEWKQHSPPEIQKRPTVFVLKFPKSTH